ncbi:precorrin-6y C5,15-methyltransferase (decarboxylating) subunit CbiE [Paraburkholderia phenoliruptrix]|uniref:precorrin-6y C5,15-methyltransferase (decarboxylating) subunit CbiE n=1 Tax=Paraburkholderia phenoliruptrix TaxID=252970 RepID=UPI002869A0B4|nr:precorrin-6y C5,15-methyltransferase (decarboxylating) subunit CbiE [Paraburkholderia phenoliruptrix]WMY12501.1 precorrin-6y C5,15-methyltransferase (decarboxylating) subunit CbiE [Paraburkholderia phenoliruptrix]
MPAWLTVVGIGDDGFAGLGRPARRALLEASVIYGGERHLSMLPARLAARRVAWPRPFDLAPLLAERGRPVCVLASGDPMLFGVGATLARQVPADALRVLPAPSSVSLAAARLGWPLQEVATVSLVGRPLASVNAYLHDGARVFVLSADGGTPAALAALLNARGFGATRMSVLEHLGGEAERRIDGRADQWSTGEVAALNLIALECRATAGMPRLPLTCGLPDDAFRHDGQLTKRDVRAITLARLAPTPGQLLWDVGAGSGSIGIEWMRAHPACRAIAIEAHAERQGFIGHNRDALGVPGLQLVAGRAPQALEGLPAPDAVFIGGGVTVPGVLEACWASLRDGGRLVANAVTLQGEAVLAAWRERQGGTLTRIALADAQPLGGFDTWRQALPITLYEAVKVSGGNDAARDRNRAASAESAESAESA